MSLLSEIKPGVRLYDRFLNRERLVHEVEHHASVIFIHFKEPHTGSTDRQPFTLADLGSRFEVITEDSFAFRADPETVRLVAEAYRIQHAYLFNKLFTTETSLIDLLPHQLAAVYGVPAFDAQPERPGMVDMSRLRFLLADDAGAGKTIMAGLLIREMLLRRLVRRVLVVPPAGLIGNWKRELEVLFRLRFRVLKSLEVTDDNNPFSDARNDLAIISVDTLWQEKVRNAYTEAHPYDLVIFDEAHKLSARYTADLTLDKTNRYEMAELIARQNRHLLLMTATPHMGKDDPYYLLWRLLEPDLLSTRDAFQRLSRVQKQQHLLRRMKEEMVHFNGKPIYLPRYSHTVNYPLRQGPEQEQELYDQVTRYCELHFDRAKQTNRSAAGLAMSILQRRLASSTWAILKSLQRRDEKLTRFIEEIDAGLLAEDELERRQQSLPTKSVRDTKTGDEEESVDGREESEQEDEAIAGATDARTLNELIAERDEVRHLVKLARQVYEQRQESKFERLWQALADYPDEKVLIFTEFRDTLDFLVDRLEGKGLTGKIAQIHGGIIPYQKRDQQAQFFRDEARVMVATDAAGEGINLQFCWLLVNYDIPWNPARLEQRMGRVHRYKQQHDVVLLSLVSPNTREGRVLKVLLDKLEAIRKELGSDKVFDIIGRQFTGKSLSDLIFEAVVEGKEDQAAQEFAGLTTEKTEVILAAQERKVETSEVRALLRALQNQQESAETRRMMPAYIRRFFQLAAPKAGVGVKGDIEGVFALEPCPPSVRRALATYPEAVQHKLTFERKRAKPDLTHEPAAIYLHPGEPVFEAVVDLFLGDFDQDGMRGGLFYDSESNEPYLFYLARALVLRDPPQGRERASAATPEEMPEVVEEQVVGLRRYATGKIDLVPAHLLLTLYPHETGQNWPETETPLWQAVGDIGPVEAFLLQAVGIPAWDRLKQTENDRIPDRVAQLRTAYNLRRAELLRQRRLLKEAVAKEVPAAASKLRQCNAELGEIDERSRQAEAELRTGVDRLRLGMPTIYAQALVLPLPPKQAAERQDAQAEAVALAEAIRREEAEGAIKIEDVSTPHLKAGFDLKVTRADGTLRYVEVKGRSGEGAVEMTVNEYIQAGNHRDKYWLYVVYNCDTVPTLYRIFNPFERLVAQQTGAVCINTGQIKAAALSSAP
jgi:superfamily II DNA or RNA helicase